MALIKMVVTKDAVEIKRHGETVFQVEIQTRMHGYEGVGNSANDDFVDPRNDEKMLDTITSKLNGVLSRLSFHKMRLESCELSLRRLKKWQVDFSMEPSKDISQFEEATEKTQRYIISKLAELDLSLKIAQSQLEVVCDTLPRI